MGSWGASGLAWRTFLHARFLICWRKSKREKEDRLHQTTVLSDMAKTTSSLSVLQEHRRALHVTKENAC